jgi:hypothetical protein
MAAGGQRAQTAMQIDQCLRNELLLAMSIPRFRSGLFLEIFGSLDFTRLERSVSPGS